MENKDALRKTVLARRDALPSRVRAEKSAHICMELAKELDTLSTVHEQSALPEQRAHSSICSGSLLVAVFSSMGSEVDLTPFVRTAYARGARVAFPCMIKNPAWHKATEASLSPEAATPACHRNAACTPHEPYTPRNLMEFYEVTAEQLENGKAPFVERPLRSFAPDAEELDAFTHVAPGEIDFALCPLVAFDAANNRLGYGGGNYDAFLSCVRPDARIVGVGFAEQEVPCGAIPLEPHDLLLPHVVSA